MLLIIILTIIIIIALYILTNSYIKDSGINFIILIIFSIIGFAIYILIGLHITNNQSNIFLIIIYWIAYTLLVLTIINIFILGFFWSVVRKKTGPYGIRGPIGDIGIIGVKGSCSINASQSFAIQRITQHLNKLYQKKNDSTTSIFKNIAEPINDYLNEKIQTLVSSNQYKITIDYMTAENMPIEGLYIYLENIWSIWFELLYNASNNGTWFLDQYADENYDFTSDSNPFEEIRKYDIFYWGMINGYRRLKVEICTDNDDKPHNENIPRLKIIESNDYDRVWTDMKSGAEYDLALWKLKNVTKNKELYYPIGLVGTYNHEHNNGRYNIIKTESTSTDGLEYIPDNISNSGNGPNRKSILIAGDVKKPIDYKPNYSFKGWSEGYMWRPIAPSGYKCLGDIFGGWHQPSKDTIRCIPEDCLDEIPNDGEVIWWPEDDYYNQVIGLRHNRPIEQNGYNIAVSKMHNNPAKFYKLKDKCINPKINIEDKELEEHNNKIAIGWNGNPIKMGEKYSIFSLVGLVPEGIITNIQNGHRYYIIHYGGIEINRYLILLANEKSKKWDNSIEVSPDKNSNKAYSSILVRNKIHQQWIMKRNLQTKKIYFINYFNNKNLAINLDPVLGYDIYSTTNDLTNKNYFNFISSYGEKQIV